MRLNRRNVRKLGREIKRLICLRNKYYKKKIEIKSLIIINKRDEFINEKKLIVFLCTIKNIELFLNEKRKYLIK